jgi:hypothetical protein
MSAPPQRRRRKLVRKRRLLAERRAALVRKHRQLARENRDLHRVELWLSGKALSGLIAMLVRTNKLSDQAAADRAKLDAAIARELEQQGARWAT